MADLLLDPNVEGYEILSVLGQGGMARVYRARQVSLNREVALKVLLPETRNDPQIAERFQREKSILKSLQHPHILPVYDFGQHGDMLWIAMQLVSGGTLGQMIGRQPMPLPDVVRIVEQVGQALAYAHRNGIVHRDLKPDNVLVAEGPHLYLSDFGIAKLMEGTVLTATGTSLGTPAYMSPEQLMNVDVDSRTDIYALGVMTYQMVTGILPFDGQVFSVMQKHLNEPPPPLRELIFDIPLQVERAIFKALEKKPDDRYTTAQEMVDAFRAAVEGRQREAAQILGQSGWHTAREEERPQEAASKKWPVLALLGGAALLGGGLLLGQGQPHRPLPRPPVVAAPVQDAPPLTPVPQPLAFGSSSNEDSGRINLLTPDAPLRQLHEGGTPRMWPDGKHVSFDYQWDVYVLKLEGEDEPYPLTAPHKAQDYWGSVSPDCSMAVFHSDRTGRFLIYGQKLKDGRPIGSPQALTDGAIADQWAAFSPDGEYIAFTRKQKRGSAIFSRNLKTGYERQLSQPKGAADECAAWAPDGKRIVFARAGSLITVDLKGKEERLPISAGLTGLAHPSWAPAQEIAFVCAQGLYTYSPETGQQHKVAERPTAGGILTYPSWGPPP